MTDFIMVPTVIGIVTLGFYKLFELFVCKKERLLMIEKMGDKFSPDMVGQKINFSSIGNISFSALKFGCLFLGIGLGLLIGYLICVTTIENYFQESAYWGNRKTISVIYGACTLVFGGIGLLVSFFVELYLSKKDKCITN